MPSDLVDVPGLRAYLGMHAVPGLDEVEVLADGSTRHSRLVAGGRCRLTVTLPALVVGTPVVTVDGDEDAVPAATAAGRRWVGLDVDPSAGVAALAADPVLGPLVTARPHLRVPGTTDPFEAAVLVVLGQHVSVAAGRVFAGRLVEALGVGNGTQQLFPTPEALATLDADDLRRTVGITGARARTVVAIARAVADGTLDLRRQEARASLLAIPGVGPWTADLVALRALRDPDVFLPGDLVLRRALGGVSSRAAATASQAWRPHRSLAVLHLWTHHAIDPP